MNLSSVGCGNQGVFVQEMKGTGKAHGVKKSYANINDISNLQKVSRNHWEATSASGAKNPDGSDKVYHFDKKGAKQVLNYLA